MSELERFFSMLISPIRVPIIPKAGAALEPRSYMAMTS